MASHIKDQRTTGIATGAIVKNRFVSADGESQKVKQSVAGEVPSGVTPDDAPNVNDELNYSFAGGVILEAGGAVPVRSPVKPDAMGRAVVATVGTDHAKAVALTEAAAAGDLFEALIIG